MAIKVKGAQGIRDKLFKMQKAPEGAAVEIAAMASDMIKQHTLAGRDRKGLKMRKYSKGYKKQQARKGRSSSVNLFDSGDMFRSMQWRSLSKSKAVIFFGRAEENTKALTNQNGKKGAESVKAHTRNGKRVGAHTRQANTPKREFFGLQKREKAKATRFLRKKYERAMK